MNTPRKSFRQQVAARIVEIDEELESMRAALKMVKSIAAQDAIMAKIEAAESNRRHLRTVG